MGKIFLRLKRSKPGFTMVEMVMAITVMSVIALLAAPLLQMTIQALQTFVISANIEEFATLTFARMTRDLQRVMNDSSIIIAEPDRIRFVDVDGLQITYRLQGNSVMRREDDQEEYKIADNIQNNGLTFTYYDDSGTALSNPNLSPRTNIRRIGIKVNLQEQSLVYTTQTLVAPRNLPHESDLFV